MDIVPVLADWPQDLRNAIRTLSVPAAIEMKTSGSSGVATARFMFQMRGTEMKCLTKLYLNGETQSNSRIQCSLLWHSAMLYFCVPGDRVVVLFNFAWR